MSDALKTSLTTITTQLAEVRTKLEAHLQDVEDDISRLGEEEEDNTAENPEIEDLETLKAGLEDSIDNLEGIESDLNALIE